MHPDEQNKVKNWHFDFSWKCVPESNVMHTGTLHDTCQRREMALLCFPNPHPAPSGRPSSFSLCRHRRSQAQLLPTSLFHFDPLSFLHFLLCLLHSYISFICHSFVWFLSFSLCLALHRFPSLCFPSLFFVFQAFPSLLAAQLLLWDCPTSFDIKISSPQRCPVFPSSRPCNIKVRGDTLAVFCARFFAAEKKRPRAGKRCHPQRSQRDECTLTKSPL